MFKAKISYCLVLLSLFFISHSITAQSDFEEGQVISKIGKQKNGTIQVIDNNGTVEAILFKESGKGKEERLGPLDIMEFSIGEKNYKGQMLWIDKSKSDSPIAKSENDFETVLDTIFLRYLVKGDVGLLEWKDEKERYHYFIENQNGILNELISHEYYENGKSGKTIQSKEYQERLANTLFGCNAITANLIEVLEYKKEELIKVTQMYNACKKAGVANKQKSLIKRKPALGVSIGLGTHTLDYIKTGEFDSRMSLAAGFSYNMRFSDDRIHLFSWQNELFFNYISNEKGTYEIELGFVKLLTMLRYEFGLTNVRPFINAGPLMTFNIIDNSTNPAFSAVSEKHPIWPDKFPVGLGFGIGGGIMVNRFSFGALYTLEQLPDGPQINQIKLIATFYPFWHSQQVF